ncbi:MAG: efflux RND transporter periplasmic adaptor subunit [Phycisphaerae bacterium]
MRTGLCVLICCGAMLCVSQVEPQVHEGIEAISRPSRDVTLSFVRPGEIEEIAVEEGDRVEPGQLLVAQDSAAERARLEALRIQAENTTSIRAAEARLEQSRVDLQELAQAAEQGAASKLEVDQARLEVTIAELSVELAKLQQKQYQSQYEQQRLLIEQMRLESPVDGTVENVHVEAGESVDALEQVVRIVNVDPLRIDAPVPLKLSAGLEVGKEVTVRFIDGEERTGRILYVSAVAEAASQTRRVRIAVDNPAGRPAGERVFVRVTDGGE